MIYFCATSYNPGISWCHRQALGLKDGDDCSTPIPDTVLRPKTTTDVSLNPTRAIAHYITLPTIKSRTTGYKPIRSTAR